MKRDQYKIVRTDGTESIIHEPPTLDSIYKAIGCGCATTVTLDKRRATVMYADDTGMIDSKPVNAKATERMRKAFLGYPYSIHGDVAAERYGGSARPPGCAALGVQEPRAATWPATGFRMNATAANTVTVRGATCKAFPAR
jgi:hypothetical protein